MDTAKGVGDGLNPEKAKFLTGVWLNTCHNTESTVLPERHPIIINIFLEKPSIIPNIIFISIERVVGL